MTLAPGPWIAVERMKHIPILQPTTIWAINDTEGNELFEIGYGPLGHRDAHLIAAAPDLLTALEAVEWVQDDDGLAEPWCPACGATISQGHREICTTVIALKKASGET